MIDLEARVQRVRECWPTLRALETSRKNALLCELADRVAATTDEILNANKSDIQRARATGLPAAKIRRLELTEDSLRRLADGVRAIAALEDPVGRVTSSNQRPNGLRVERIRCPIGVIAMIYEARPAVTIDAFALCFKSGNAVILKSGREADTSNVALAAIVQECLRDHDLPQDAILQLTATSRDAIKDLLQMDDHIDLVIPRGGESLIRFVAENSRIPTVQHFHGVCHTYIDASADISSATEICVTAKTSAPATCNALECVLVHKNIAAKILPPLVDAMKNAGVEVRADEAARLYASTATPASDDDYGREFLDLIVAIRIVDDMDAAIEHIETHGSAHTDAIVCDDNAAAAEFTRRVQSSCVLVNASTRFNDGFELGLGAEIGISTQRVHAFGPMGLEELTVQRYIVHGDGQTR
jgi:glutamate-5-semialdehyde dehydrogenase